MAVVEERRGVEKGGGGPKRAASIIYKLFGILEALLALRFIFLLLGANSANGFVKLVYAITYPFVAPFYGIFGQVTAPDARGVAVFDFDTLVAMAVYAIVAWGIVRLVAALGGGRP